MVGALAGCCQCILVVIVATQIFPVSLFSVISGLLNLLFRFLSSSTCLVVWNLTTSLADSRVDGKICILHKIIVYIFFPTKVETDDLGYLTLVERQHYLQRQVHMIRWELNRKDLEIVPKNFQICMTGWKEEPDDPHKLSNADSLIKWRVTTITITASLTNKFHDSGLLGTLNERCTYPWVLSVQLLPWLVQVLFSHPLTFASVLSLPMKPRRKYLLSQTVNDFIKRQQVTGLQLHRSLYAV